MVNQIKLKNLLTPKPNRVFNVVIHFETNKLKG